MPIFPTSRLPKFTLVIGDQNCTSSPAPVLSYMSLPWKALRLNAVSMNLFSSFRWVDLFPVAGAAAGSRPTYLEEGLEVRHNILKMHCSFLKQAEQKPLPNGPLVGDHSEETWPDVIVVSHVLVLLLTPDQLSVAVLLRLRLDQVKREWRDLRGKVEEETLHHYYFKIHSA